MNRFNKFIEQILKNEGGYVNHPQDPGGETNYGITKHTATNYGYNGSMKDIPIELVKRIYFENYWLLFNCENYPFKTSFMVLDAYVNHAPHTANKMIQRAVGVRDDGIMGAKTREAIISMNDDVFLLNLTSERLKQYTSNNRFPTFGRGWINRIADNLRFLS